MTSLNTNEFLYTYAFINNPHQQSSGVLIFLCKHYIVISDKLVGFFLDVFFLLLAVILSELHDFMRNQKRKIELQRKVHRSICMRDITFLTARSPFYAFLLLSFSTPSPFPSDTFAKWLLQRYIYCYEWHSV